MKKIVIKALKWFVIILAVLLAIGFVFPTWTPKIQGENSICELRKVKINNTNLEIMIRGNLAGQSPKEMVIFENSAHYPQFEEKEKFFEWMCNTFA